MIAALYAELQEAPPEEELEQLLEEAQSLFEQPAPALPTTDELRDLASMRYG
jgi:hypothetical protein